MISIPKDNFILLSFLNLKLRDEYNNLSDLCNNLNLNENDIIDKMKNIGYIYSFEQNSFIVI